MDETFASKLPEVENLCILLLLFVLLLIILYCSTTVLWTMLYECRLLGSQS